MQYILKAPDNLKTEVKLPASKSIGNRALVINALAGGSYMPDNLSDCDDTDVMLRALRDMPYEIDIKAAGTAMRFMTAYLAATCHNRYRTYAPSANLRTCRCIAQPRGTY